MTALVGCHRAPAEPPVVTILCYHTFDSPKVTPFTVTSRRFSEQLRFLKVQHIPVIPLAQLVDYLQGKGTLPPRAVVITIDDGYKTALTIARPILRRYGFPFTLFIYPQAIERHSNSLNWNDVRILAKAGVDIQSHSFTHPLLTHPGKAMSRADYTAWLDQELAGSKKEIETRLGQAVTSLAYPFGGYDELVVERTRQAGYLSALTCADGDVAAPVDLLHLSRRLVFHGTSFKAYAGYFAGKPLWVDDLSPRDGERVSGMPAEIRARIRNVQEILPESAEILVDKLGKKWRKVPVDAKTGELRFPIPPLTKRGYFFVSLVAKDKANPAVIREASWLFIVKKNASIK